MKWDYKDFNKDEKEKEPEHSTVIGQSQVLKLMEKGETNKELSFVNYLIEEKVGSSENGTASLETMDSKQQQQQLSLPDLIPSDQNGSLNHHENRKSSRKEDVSGECQPSDFSSCPMCQRSMILSELIRHARNCNGDPLPKGSKRKSQAFDSCPLCQKYLMKAQLVAHARKCKGGSPEKVGEGFLCGYCHEVIEEKSLLEDHLIQCKLKEKKMKQKEAEDVLLKKKGRKISQIFSKVLIKKDKRKMEDDELERNKKFKERDLEDME